MGYVVVDQKALRHVIKERAKSKSYNALIETLKSSYPSAKWTREKLNMMALGKQKIQIEDMCQIINSLCLDPSDFIIIFPF